VSDTAAVAAGPDDVVEDLYPLSPLQQGILFHALHDPAAAVYISQFTARVRGTDPARISRAWQDLADRHPVLRTAFLWEGLDDPVQVVYRRARLPVNLVDWRNLPAAEQDRRAAAFLQADRNVTFDPQRAPLARLSLLWLADDVVQLVWSHHGLILDGWSSSRLLSEAMRGNGAPDVRDAGAPAPAFRDYIAWIQRQDRAAGERYWREVLGDVSQVSRFPLADPARCAGAGGWAAHDHWLSPEETARVLQATRDLRIPLVVLAQGAWGLTLARCGGADEAIFGMVVSGRSAGVPGIEQMIGLLTNTVPVRVTVRGRQSAGDWLRSLLASHASTMEHEHTPLAEVQRSSGVPAGQALFDSVLSVQNFPGRRHLLRPGAEHRVTRVAGYETTHYPVTVFLIPGPQLLVRIFYDRAVVTAANAATAAASFCRALSGLAAEPGRPLSRVPVFADDPDGTWPAGPAGDWPLDETVASAITAAMTARPDAPAVTERGVVTTYAELDRRSAAVAAGLTARGIGAEDLVAIVLPRSADSVIATVGVLRAGAAYLPVDPGYPPARIAHMLADSGSRLVLCRGDLLGRLPGDVGQDRVLLLDELPASASRPASSAVADNLAYVIYTSGSTGKPKGVMISHRAAANMLRWLTAEFRRGAVAHKVPVGFTDAVFEVLWPLCTGSVIAIIDDDTVRDPGAFWAELQRCGVTCSQLVPRQMQAILESAGPGTGAAAPSLRWVINGAEALPATFAAEWRRRFDGVLVANLYGMTESAVFATSHLATGTDTGATVPIGRPIANMSAHVVSRELEQCPAGVTGELYLGGVGLARGYLGRPGRTAERFVPDPFGEPGARLYRTGDLARWCAGRVLECVGRADFQLKVRGFRVEPGEVESVLREHPAVRDAVVVARDDRLVAYLVPAAGADPVPAGELRAWLAEYLPAHMVPAAATWLERLPVNAHGKVDRAALPEPGHPGGPGAAFTPPRGSLEKLVAALWAEVLPTDKVGAFDDFFGLGGDSLLAVRAVGRIRDMLPVDYTVGRLFADRTVAACGESLAALLGPAEELGELIDEIERAEPAEDLMPRAAGGGEHG
jgi:amino acid adenylation domain-containing protein